MTTWLDPGRAQDSTHEHLDTITLGVLINNYCYGKTQLRITRDFLCDLRRVLNSRNTSIFLRVSCRYLLTVHDATKSLIIYLTKTGGLLPPIFLVSYKKDTTKDSEARQSIKP